LIEDVFVLSFGCEEMEGPLISGRNANFIPPLSTLFLLKASDGKFQIMVGGGAK